MSEHMSDTKNFEVITATPERLAVVRGLCFCGGLGLLEGFKLACLALGFVVEPSLGELAGREPLPDLLLALRGQVDEFHAGNFVEVASPNDAPVDLNGILREIGQFKADDLADFGKAGELKGHAVVADVD